jgi:PEP-CTERM motif
MKLLKIAALVAAMGVGAAQAVPVVFSSVVGTAGVTGTSFAHDGNYPPLWQFWQTDTAWWTGFNESVVFEFDQPYQITGFKASLDNNDDYVIELSNDNGETWTRYYTVFSEDGTVSDGMDTFEPAVAGSTNYFSQARVRARAGDGFHSIGELQFSGTTAPIPEPETLALMLGGIAALGLKLRRRAS